MQTLGLDLTKIPREDLVGVSAVLVTCSYREKQFFRVGFYTNIFYDDDALNEALPNPPVIERLVRRVMGSEPRVTHFPIEWDKQETVYPTQFPTLSAEGQPMGSENVKSMYEQDRKDMFSNENVQKAAMNLGSAPLGTNQNALNQ